MAKVLQDTLEAKNELSKPSVAEVDFDIERDYKETHYKSREVRGEKREKETDNPYPKKKFVGKNMINDQTLVTN